MHTLIDTSVSCRPTTDLNRIAKFGEVFTPPEFVRSMTDLLDQGVWSDPRIILVEPTCGDGNVVVEALRRRIVGLGTGRDLHTAIALSVGTLWAFDIQRDNLERCRVNVLRTVLEHLNPNGIGFRWIKLHIQFIAAISAAIEYQIRVGDAMEFTYPLDTFLSLSSTDQQKAAQWKVETIYDLSQGDMVNTWLTEVFYPSNTDVVISEDSPWTPNTVTQLCELWEDGISAREIGRRLGVTYSAVTNKARWLQLPLRGSPIAGQNPDIPIFTWESEQDQ